MSQEESTWIPVGPQHPFLKEAAKFDFEIRGEEIVGARYQMGYNHRGIEKACEDRNYYQALYLLERVCGICSHSHTSAYCMAVEQILGLELPERGAYMRTLVCELERIHSHLLWVGVAAHEVGFDTLFMYTWRDREIVMEILEEVCGNRVNYAINTIGGVRRDITDPMRKKILGLLDALVARVAYYAHIGTSEPSFVARIKGVGTLSHEKAVAMCAVGPFARASGLAMDIRKDDPYAAYSKLDFKVVWNSECDIFGRVLVRCGELLESISMVRQILENLPEGPVEASKVPRRIPAGVGLARYEAPRGEDVHYVRGNGTDKPERVKVRAPTMANAVAATESVIGCLVADIPIAIASMDPCFSCTDRTTIVLNDPRKGRQVMDMEEMRRYSIDWYRTNKGIRLS